MADWTENNRACKTVWTTLSVLNQLKTNFADSGELKMNDLAFFNPLDSVEMRKQQAAVIADQLDTTFRVGRGAKYEIGFGRTKAFSGMIAILTDAEKQVADLAAAIDTFYNFLGEVKI